MEEFRQASHASSRRTLRFRQWQAQPRWRHQQKNILHCSERWSPAQEAPRSLAWPCLSKLRFARPSLML